jgi:predicted HD superfamily hydrolase involved in NAD metabolism
LTHLQLEKELKKRLTPKRFHHSVNIKEVAIQLAQIHQVDRDKAIQATLLHDIAKDLDVMESFNKAEELSLKLTTEEKNHPPLIHSKLGAEIVEKELGINDPEILEAIRTHTTGKAGMSSLSLVVFVADYLDPEKQLKNYKLISHIARENLYEASLLVSISKLEYVLESLVPFSKESIDFYNWLLTIRNEKLSV